MAHADVINDKKKQKITLFSKHSKQETSLRDEKKLSDPGKEVSYVYTIIEYDVRVCIAQRLKTCTDACADFTSKHLKLLKIRVQPHTLIWKYLR